MIERKTKRNESFGRVQGDYVHLFMRVKSLDEMSKQCFATASRLKTFHFNICLANASAVHRMFGLIRFCVFAGRHYNVKTIINSIHATLQCL